MDIVFSLICMAALITPIVIVFAMFLTSIGALCSWLADKINNKTVSNWIFISGILIGTIAGGWFVVYVFLLFKNIVYVKIFG